MSGNIIEKADDLKLIGEDYVCSNDECSSSNDACIKLCFQDGNCEKYCKGDDCYDPDVLVVSSLGYLRPEDWRLAHLIKASASMVDALTHAEAILTYCPQMTTNKGGKGPMTTTRLALKKVRAALAATEPEGK